MRKLALLFLLLALPLAAQSKDLIGRVPTDAGEAGECAAGRLLRLAQDGLVPGACLPTASATLVWFLSGDEIEVAATAGFNQSTPNHQAARVTRIFCRTNTGTVDLNFDSRAITAQGTPGTDLHTSEIVATSTGVTVTSFAGDDENAANQDWALSISAVSGAPTELGCWMTVEKL